MTDLPETVTLDWIGRTLLEMKSDIRSLNERVGRLEERFDRSDAETSDRYSNIESALFRADACWRAVQEASNEILHHLKAKLY